MIIVKQVKKKTGITYVYEGNLIRITIRNNLRNKQI